MIRSRVLVVLTTLVVVALQLAVFTQWRFAGSVVMVVWLWPVAVALTGLTSMALWAGALAGLLFDAQVATPFGLSALVGIILAYAVSRLGKEGVGDLDSTALWVTPLLAAGAGLVAPVIFVASGVFRFDFSLWHYGVVDSMIVNAVAFFVLARPLTRLAFVVCAPALRTRR